MKNPLIRLREIYNYLGDSERIVAEYLLAEPDAVLDHNIRELAAKLYVSPSVLQAPGFQRVSGIPTGSDL